MSAEKSVMQIQKKGIPEQVTRLNVHGKKEIRKKKHRAEEQRDEMHTVLITWWLPRYLTSISLLNHNNEGIAETIPSPSLGFRLRPVSAMHTCTLITKQRASALGIISNLSA